MVRSEKFYDDMIGSKFGKLTVLSKSHWDDKRKVWFWKCLCDCGNEAVVNQESLRRKKSGVKSCGCLRKETIVAEKENLVGKRFGKLVVISESHKNKYGEWFWNCVCDCGKTVSANGNSMKRGNKKSCGCLLGAHSRRVNTKHGRSTTRLYQIHSSMRARCTNEKHMAYRNYGGRGIKIYEKWMNFEAFESWAKENGYAEDLTIERINVDGNYEPSNCKWIPLKEQIFNRRIPKSNKSGYVGITYKENLKKFDVRLSIRKKPIFIGYYDTFIEAFIARREEEFKYYEGRYLYEYPDLNKIREVYKNNSLLFSKDGEIPKNIEELTNKEESVIPVEIIQED